jgi:hypothetical protein
VDTEIRRALDVWSSYTQLNFEQRESGRVHIDIRYSFLMLLCFYKLSFINRQSSFSFVQIMHPPPGNKKEKCFGGMLTLFLFIFSSSRRTRFIYTTRRGLLVVFMASGSVEGLLWAGVPSQDSNSGLPKYE